MYYNPQTQEMLSDQELKNRLNISFPKSTESVDGWLYIHESIPESQEGYIPVKDSIEILNGQATQIYKMEPSPIDQTSSEPEEIAHIKKKISQLEGCIEELAAMLSNLHVYCTNAIEKVKETNK